MTEIAAATTVTPAPEMDRAVRALLDFMDGTDETGFTPEDITEAGQVVATR